MALTIRKLARKRALSPTPRAPPTALRRWQKHCTTPLAWNAERSTPFTPTLSTKTFWTKATKTTAARAPPAFLWCPTKTGAATAIGEVLPALAGRLSGLAVRAPVANVSLIDFTCVLQNKATAQDINAAFAAAAARKLAGVLAVCDLPLVSCDFAGRSESAIVDLPQTQVTGGQAGKGFGVVRQRMGLCLPHVGHRRRPRRRGVKIAFPADYWRIIARLWGFSLYCLFTRRLCHLAGRVAAKRGAPCLPLKNLFAEKWISLPAREKTRKMAFLRVPPPR